MFSVENKPLKVLIEFSLENPKGGVQFVLPPEGTSQDAMVRIVHTLHDRHVYLTAVQML